MVNVKLFGLFRLETGLKELQAQAGAVRELYPILLAEAKRLKPDSTISAADIDGCIVMINGVRGKKSSKLADGDTVMLISPVCGG